MNRHFLTGFLEGVLFAAVFIAVLANSAQAADCVRTPEAVLAGHPGGHAIYVTRAGVKCWLLEKHPRAGGKANDSVPSRERRADTLTASDRAIRPPPPIAALPLSPQRRIDLVFMDLGWRR
jgi:hypothetical protein